MTEIGLTHLGYKVEETTSTTFSCDGDGKEGSAKMAVGWRGVTGLKK
jgi:hypothetical protein